MLKRHHEVTRLEGFTDAVFAFALTLLVVSLEVPKDVAHLKDLVRGFVPFGLMFAMICWIWYEHNKFFRRYGLQDAWTVFLNCVLLFVVLFYVYPLKFLTTGLVGPLFGITDTPALHEVSDGQVLLQLYSGGVVMIFGTFLLLYRHARNQRAELDLTPRDEIALRFEIRAHAISFFVGIASVTIASLAFIHPLLVPISGFLYFAMGPLHGWNGAAEGRAVRAFEGATAAPMTAPASVDHAKR